MSAARGWFARLRATLWPDRHRAQADAELREELEAHLAMQIEENVRRGMSAEAARRAAIGETGGVTAGMEAYRERRGFPIIESLARDIVYGARSLGKSPILSAAVVLTLALGIGATTVMFSVVDGIMIHPLPFANANRLVWTVNHGTRPYDAMSPPDFADWSRLVPSFEAVASWVPAHGAIEGNSGPIHVDISEVTDNWFQVLGVRPQLGRGFVRGEQGSGIPTVVVISDALWRSSFGADPKILGRVVRIDGGPFTVVGVAPRGFDFPDKPDVWRPVALTPAIWANRGSRVFRGPVALLRRGVTFDKARAEALVAAAQLRRQFPASESGLSFDIQPLQTHLVGDRRAPLLILLGAVATLLLIACVNVAALLLVRASARSCELGVRLALGASTRRLASQLLVESLLLAIAGGLLGVCLAFVGVHAVVAANVGSLPLLWSVSVRSPVLLFATAVTIGVGMGFGIAPAFHAIHTNVVDALRAGARGSSATRSTARLRAMLVAIEVALVVPLLVGASLLTKSFDRLLTSNPGFKAEQLVHFDISLPVCGTIWRPDPTCGETSGAHYNRSADIRRFVREAITQMQAMPGTIVASAGFGAPFTPWATNQSTLNVQGLTPPNQMNPVENKVTAPGYFAALGSSIVEGRDFSWDDFHGREECQTVAIISEGAAKAYFGGEPALNKQVVWSCGTSRVIGIAKDIDTQSLGAAPEPALYFNYAQAPTGYVTMLVRSTADPMTVMREARRIVASIDPTVAVYGMEPMTATVARAAAPARLAARVIGGFAVAALLLAIVGIYGLISHVVRERHLELGIRTALGARPAQLTAFAMRGGLGAVLAGLLPGVLLSLACAPLLRSLLYGVGPTDGATYGVVAAALGAIAVVACWIPARRAAHIDPTIALRAD